jgi:hypothetical protein
MYVLACVPIYGDRGRDYCFDPARSQEGPPEFGLGCGPAIANVHSPIAQSHSGLHPAASETSFQMGWSFHHISSTASRLLKSFSGTQPIVHS